jgi:hypothetical protein
LSPPGVNESGDGGFSYDKDIHAQIMMGEEDSVITAFDTFPASSPQIVGELEPDGNAELDDDPD